MSNENDNGALERHGEGDTVGAPLVPPAATAPQTVPPPAGRVPSEIFSKLQEHPQLLDVMTRAMNGETVNPQEMHAALVQAGVETPGAPARAPRRLAPPDASAEPRRRVVREPEPPPEEPEMMGPEEVDEVLKDVPLDFLLSRIGLRLWNALGTTMPGCHLAITLAEEGVHAVILLPPDAELEEDEPFALANIQGDPDQLGEVCNLAFDAADNALQKIREDGAGR